MAWSREHAADGGQAGRTTAPHLAWRTSTRRQAPHHSPTQRLLPHLLSHSQCPALGQHRVSLPVLPVLPRALPASPKMQWACLCILPEDIYAPKPCHKGALFLFLNRWVDLRAIWQKAWNNWVLSTVIWIQPWLHLTVGTLNSWEVSVVCNWWCIRGPWWMEMA